LVVGGIVSGLTHNAWQAYGPGAFAWLMIGLGCGYTSTTYKRREPIAFHEHEYHPVRRE